MKNKNRKVLKLGVTTRDLERFVQAHKNLKTDTLSETLSALLDRYEEGVKSWGTF